MKKIYEAPVAEEIYADVPALMSDALLSGNDNSGDDLAWDLL